MILSNVKSEYFNRGVFTFENGKYIWIEEIQYSYDGSYWESTFLPEKHIDPRDPTASIEGHKYRRVRHAGDNFFQNPAYIVAEDGKKPLMTLKSDGIHVKYEDEADDKYTLLVPIATMAGTKGDQGEKGQGWNINYVGYWMTKPLSVSGTSGIASCSGGATQATGVTTFLSMGDGLHTIITADQTGSKYRSDDGITWIAIQVSDVGNTTRWMADDAIGTGKLDYREQNTLSTKGKVYYWCSDDVTWKLLFNVAVAQHRVSPTAAYYGTNQTGFFMDTYVGTVLNATPITDTIALTAGYKLVVKKNTIEPAHFKDGSFGDGFDEGTADVIQGIMMSTIKAKAGDFAGFGLGTYTSAGDTFTDMQVNAQVLVANGMQAYNDSANQADGESRYKFQVKPEDLVDVSLSGLDTFTNTDGYKDLRVKVYNGLVIDTNGLNASYDDLAIAVDTNKKLTIKPYVAGNDGILALHLNPIVANTSKGLKVSNTTGLEVYLHATESAMTYDSNGLRIGSHAIQGIHLKSDVADATKGIKMDETTNMLEVMLKSAGGLKFTSGEIELDPANIGWMNSYVVKKLTVGTSEVKGDVILQGDASSDTYMQIVASISGQTITIKPTTQLAAFQTLIDSRIAAVGVSSHTHVTANVTDLQAKLDAKLDKGTAVGSVYYGAQGIYIKNASGNAWGKLVCVDDDFNLGVIPNQTPA